jgi:hypothetical protein
MRAPCLEFPSDNPELLEGATWTCDEAAGQVICEAETAEEAPAEFAFESVERVGGIVEDACFVLDGDDAMDVAGLVETKGGGEGVLEGDDEDESSIEIVEELEEIQVADEGPASGDPFHAFLSTLAEVALTAGGEAVAEDLPALVAAETFDASTLPEAAIEALVDGGLLERTDSGVARGSAFTRAARAWRCVLRGDSDDLSECGSRTLDEWAADLVARLVAAPSKAEQLRRELRKRGVAAFGLVVC